jgi:Sap, sulfolipid-1-addressing protein
MWITVLVMAIAVSLEPFRIGMAVLMLSRPRPFLQLLALLSGGFAMGISVGLVVLFLFPRALVGSKHFTLPNVQIVIGVLALLVAVLLATGVMPAPKLPVQARRVAYGPSLWFAGVAGLGIALPSVDYLAALALIIAAGATPSTQVGVLLMFNIVAFALVEIPVVAYLVAPGRTRESLAALNDWIRSRRRGEVAALLAGVGAVLVAVGVTGL